MADEAALEPTEVFPPLPGLELGELPTDERPNGIGPQEHATARTIAAMRAQLGEPDAGLCQLALTLARTVDRAVNAHAVRASSVAMAAKELRECLQLLNPTDEGGPAGDAFDQLAAAIGKLATD